MNRLKDIPKHFLSGKQNHSLDQSQNISPNPEEGDPYIWHIGDESVNVAFSFQ